MKELKNNVESINPFWDRIPLWLLIFLLSSFNFVSFDTWPNEENNFTMARHFLDSEWMKESFSLQQWPGTNFIFWSIAGFGLKFFSFGQLAFFLRLINYLLYAFPLSKIFKALKINKMAALLILQIFFFKQEYLAGEWIWKGFEGKTLAYLFVFWSLYTFINGRYYKTAIFAAIATYCHVLIGGWFFVGIGIYLILSKYSFKHILKISLVYLLIAIPFVGYLAYFIFSGEKVINDPSPDWIYVFFRNRHHLIPTMKDHFWEHNWPFVLLMLLSPLLLIKKWFNQEEGANSIVRLLVAFQLLLLAGLVLTYVDKTGTLLKFYALRMTSIALFLQLLVLALFLIKYIKTSKKSYQLIIGYGLALTVLVTAFFGLQKNLKEWQVTPLENSYYQFIDFTQKNTSKDDKFCFINFKDKRENVRFINDSERDRLVSYKMVPEGDFAIVEWYNRILSRDKVEKNPYLFVALSEKYNLKYLVSKVPVKDKIFKLKYSNQYYYVYELKK